MGIERGVNFPITATDGFSAVFDKLKSQVGQAQGSFDQFKGYLTSAFAGLSVAGLSAMVLSTVEAMNHLNDLAKTTSLTVEELSGLSLAAKQTATDLDGLTGELNKLSVNMGKNAESFNRLGISTKDPLKALEQLSDLFVSLQDPMQRDAVMAQAMGKAWATAAPLLAKGGSAIAQMVDEGAQLSGVTGEMAQQAEELNGKWVKLTASHHLLNSLVGDALPLLNKLADTLLDVQKASQSSAGGFNPLTEALRATVVLGGNVIFVIRGIGTEIGVWMAQMQALLEAVGAMESGDTAGAATAIAHFNAISADAKEQAAGARKSFDEWERSMMAVGTAADTSARSVTNAGKAAEYTDQASRRAANEASAAARAFLEDAKLKAEAAKLEESYQRQLGEANAAVAVAKAEAANGADRLTTSEKKFIELLQDPTFKKYPQWQQDVIAGVLKHAAAIERVTESYKKYAKAVEGSLSFLQQYNEETAALEAPGNELIHQLKDQIDQGELEIEVMGKSSAEREIAALRLKQEKEMRGTLTTSQLAAVSAYYAEIEALVKLRHEREDQLALYDAEGSAAGKFFSDLLFDTKHAFSNMVEEAKRFGAELAALFAKRYLLQMAGSVVGGSAGADMTQAGVNAGVNTVGGSVLNAAGNYISGTTIAGSAVGGFSDAAAGYTAQSAYLAGTAETAASTSTWMGTLGSALAEIPVWGWIAAAVIAVAVWLSGQGGGPKIGGSFTGGFTGAGDFLGQMAAPGTQNGRLFTPNNGDEPMRQLVTGMGHSFAATLSALGGTSGGARFGIGFDSDPNGRAPDRVSSVVSDLGGHVIYSHNNVVPEQGQKLEELLALESQRMILAALQASDLPKDIANILNTLDAKTATAAQIQKVIALAQSFQHLSDTIAALEGGPVVALQQQLKALDANVSSAKAAYSDALGGKDQGAILSAEQTLEQAVMNRYNSEISMVRELQSMIRQTEEAAYQFAINIAGRISSLGGSANVGGIAMNRASSLRGGIGSSAPNPVDLQLEDLNSYVGAVDTWYQARKAAIEADTQAQAAAGQAMAQAQSAAAQARVQQLQTELQMVQQFQTIVDRTTQMLTDMKLGSTNPASVFERLQISQQDVERLKATYESTSGTDRVDAANKLLDALDREKQLGMEAYPNGRPGDDWEKIYNGIVSEITKVQGDAQPIADRTFELQQQILDAQKMAEQAQAATASSSASSSAALDALNAEALPYYEWAQSEGERLYAAQRQEHQEQLNAITGGVEVNLFIAQKQAEAVDELKEIRRLLSVWAAANPSVPGPSSGGSTGGGKPGGSLGDTGGGDGNEGGLSDSAFMKTAQRNAPALNRMLNLA